MKTVFTSLLLGLAGTLWSVAAQAASYLEPGTTPTEPGAYKELSYRYTFDVIGRERSAIGGDVVNVDTGEVVTDPVLAQTVKDRIDPFRSTFGKTGRVTIEVSNVLLFGGHNGQIINYSEYSLAECISGFLCDPDLNLFYNPFGIGYYIYPDNRDYIYGSPLLLSENGFRLRYGDIYWSTLSFVHDDDYGGYFYRNTVTIDGVTYRGGGLDPFESYENFQGSLTITNFRGRQIHPAPVPLPASGLLLIGVLGGAAALARRRAGRAQGRR